MSEKERVLIGSTNPSKIASYRKQLELFGYETVGLKDLGITGEPEENGTTPEENARIKAAFYGQFADKVVCDDAGLYFAGIPMDHPLQPGLHVRTPQANICGRGKELGIPEADLFEKDHRLTDDEMRFYYKALVRRLLKIPEIGESEEGKQGFVRMCYPVGTGVCVKGKVFSFMESIETVALKDYYYMTETETSYRHDGWPMDSITIDPHTGMYLADPSRTIVRTGNAKAANTSAICAATDGEIVTPSSYTLFAVKAFRGELE